MQENLNVGTLVTGLTEQTSNAIIEKYCYDDTEANCTSDGGLYQWNEAMQYETTPPIQGICPAGWHIPTDAELHTLDDLYDGGTCDSTRLGWGCDPTAARLSTFTVDGDNSSGFTALFAGIRSSEGLYTARGINANFLSSSEYNSTGVRYRHVSEDWSEVYCGYNEKTDGISVRCLKD